MSLGRLWNIEFDEAGGGGVLKNMTFAQLFQMISKADLSPEQFGSYLGVSGMTIRRWKDEDAQAEVPELYRMGLVKVVEKLIMQGFLKMEDSEVRPFLKNRETDHLKLNLQTLGLDLEELEKLQNKSGKQDMVHALSRIGESVQRQEQVVSHLPHIKKLAVLHGGMKASVKSLLGILKMKNIATKSKFVAFGALFYLIAPLDLIPDTVPIFGFVDDIAILNLAAIYYASGFKRATKSDGLQQKNSLFVTKKT